MDGSSRIHGTAELPISSPLVNKGFTKTVRGPTLSPTSNGAPQSAPLSDLSPASGLGGYWLEGTICPLFRENLNTDDGIPKVTLVVLGAQGVGKSTFIRNCYEQQMPDFSFVFKKMQLEGVVYYIRLFEMPLDKSIRINGSNIEWPASYKGIKKLSVDGAFILYDVTNKTRILPNQRIMLELQKAGIPHLTVLCKCDILPPERQLELGSNLGLPFTGLGTRITSASNSKSQMHCISAMLRAIFPPPKTANSLQHLSVSYSSSGCCKPRCLWCEPALPRDKAIEWRPNASPQTRLSGSECKLKMALAHFYFSARSYDDAWRVYAEVLCRSQELSCPDRMLVAVSLMKSSSTLPQYLAARRKLANILLSEENSAVELGEPLWVTHILLAVVRHAEGDIDGAVQHLQSATEQCFNAPSMSSYGPDLKAYQTLVTEVTESLRRKTAEVDKGLPFASHDLFRYHEVLGGRWGGLPVLLKWCLRQVELGGYHILLGSSCDKPWTTAPNLMALTDFENTTLFCFLWQRYRKAGSEIGGLVEHLKDSLHIPLPMIFSTVSSMKPDVETASLLTTHLDFRLEKVVQRAVFRLKRLSEIGEMTMNGCHFLRTRAHTYLANMFFETYASFNREIKTVEPQEREYRRSVQNFARHIALRDPLSSAREAAPLRRVRQDECYHWRTSSLSDAESMAVEELGDGIELLPGLRLSASPNVESESVAAVPDQKSDKRPESLASINMSTTPRSSFTSSKASLRSMQRLTLIAQSLLKRGGSGEGQLPSEVMDRDSHSSWSLRRFTGVSYLSASTEMTTEDVLAEQDTVMRDAPFAT